MGYFSDLVIDLMEEEQEKKRRQKERPAALEAQKGLEELTRAEYDVFSKQMGNLTGDPSNRLKTPQNAAGAEIGG